MDIGGDAQTRDVEQWKSNSLLSSLSLFAQDSFSLLTLSLSNMFLVIFVKGPLSVSQGPHTRIVPTLQGDSDHFLPAKMEVAQWKLPHFGTNTRTLTTR